MGWINVHKKESGAASQGKPKRHRVKSDAERAHDYFSIAFSCSLINTFIYTPHPIMH